MFEKFIRLFRIKDLRKKILFVLFILAVSRLIAIIPIPGINPEKLQQFFSGSQFFGMLSVFTGGSMSRMSIGMLGLGPFITATIIMQLLTMIFPKLKEMHQEAGEKGRDKFNQYARIATVPLAALQGYAFLNVLGKQGIIDNLSGINMFANIVIIAAGAVLLMWLGEMITQKGIGNGISLLIFAGIVGGIPAQLGQLMVTWDQSNIFSYILFLATSLIVISAVIFITEGQKNIPISYAKRIRGHKMYGGASTFLPLRINQAGVIPIIFAISIMLFPGMIATFLKAASNPKIVSFAVQLESVFQNQIFYMITYFGLVVAFTYFYTAVSFDPKNVAENLQKSGGFIPGIRPGINTSQYISYIINRITLIGAIFLGLIAILPMIVQNLTGVQSFQFLIGGTALLIVVSVVLETIKQINAQLVMRDYDSF
jgi:preprotein translocase subunit SecY